MVNNNDGKNGSGGVMGAAIFGAVIGAAAVALLNKDMRKNLKKTIMDSLEKGEEKLGEVSEKANALKSQVTKKTSDKLKEVKKRIDQAA